MQYSQWTWGFEVFDSETGKNDLLDFNRGGQVLATLTPGVYTADEFASEVARALNAADVNNYVCTFNYLTLKFHITCDASVTLNSVTGPNRARGPWGLLGFDTGALQDPSGTAIDSELIAGQGTPDTAGAWTAAEPLIYASPVSAQALPNGSGTAYSPAGLTQRSIGLIQHVTHGGIVESIYVATLRKVQIAFRAIAAGTEQSKMESFLNWAVQGKRFTWQPDKTSTNGMKLMMAYPGQINNGFEWLARPEVGYGTFTFYEQAK
jgi:hypothetical protein